MADPKAQAAAKSAVVAASAAWEIYLAMAQAGVQFVSDVADATGIGHFPMHGVESLFCELMLLIINMVKMQGMQREMH